MKKVSKVILSLLLAGALAVPFAACQRGNDPDNGDKPGPVTPLPDNNPAERDGNTTGYFFPEAGESVTFTMNLKGGSFSGLKKGDVSLTRNEQFRYNVGTNVLTMEASYLNTLEEGEHTFTFSTNRGSCELKVIKGANNLTEGYQFSFAKEDMNPAISTPTAETFYAKVSRTATAAEFSFLTFGDFGYQDGMYEFINVLIDIAPYEKSGLNWSLTGKDFNFRAFSDGTVVYRNDFGDVPIADIIWWRSDRTEDMLEPVTITRQGGVTSFTVSVPYELLGIEADDNFRFTMMEGSEASDLDFNLYEEGWMDYWKNNSWQRLGGPATPGNWPLVNKDGQILLPGEIVAEGAPADHNISFAKARDEFYAKIAPTAGATDGSTTFSFWTPGGFAKDGAVDEFVMIYLDLAPYNLAFKGNWRLESGDCTIRIYSDGSAYRIYDFADQADNIWVKRNGDEFSRDNNHPKATKLDNVAITTDPETGAQSFSLNVTPAMLGVQGTLKGFRFYLAEASDNSSRDFNFYGSDVQVNGTAFGDGANCSNYALYSAKTGTITLPSEIPAIPSFAASISVDSYTQTSNTLTLAPTQPSAYTLSYALKQPVAGVSLNDGVLTVQNTVKNGTQIVVVCTYSHEALGIDGTLEFTVNVTATNSMPEDPSFTDKDFSYDLADDNAVKTLTLAPEAGAYEHYVYTYTLVGGDSDGFSITDNTLTSTVAAVGTHTVTVQVSYTDTKNASAPARKLTFTVTLTVSNSETVDDAPTFADNLSVSYDVYTAEAGDKQLTLTPTSNASNYNITYAIKGLDAHAVISGNVLTLSYAEPTEKTLTVIASFEKDSKTYTVEFNIDVLVVNTEIPAFDNVAVLQYVGGAEEVTLAPAKANSNFEITYSAENLPAGVSLQNGVLTVNRTVLGTTSITVTASYHYIASYNAVADGSVTIPVSVQTTQIVFGDGEVNGGVFGWDTDVFEATLEQTAEGLTLHFTAEADFGSSAGKTEYIMLWFDMNGVNEGEWNIGANDVNIRVGSDGNVYYHKITETTNNPWWRGESDALVYTKIGSVAMTTVGAYKTFTLNITKEQLGITDATNTFRLLMKEGRSNIVTVSENDNTYKFKDYDLADGNTTVNTTRIGVDNQQDSWIIYDWKNQQIGFTDNMTSLSEAKLYFGKEHVNADKFDATIKKVAGGVQFTFATDSDFGMNGSQTEYIDLMIEFTLNRTTPPNWQIDNGIQLLLYSDGSIKWRKTFPNVGDPLWNDSDPSTYSNVLNAADGTFTVTDVGGKTVVTLVLKDSFLYGEDGERAFLFQMRECSNGKGGHRDTLYNGYTKIDGVHYVADGPSPMWATFDPTENSVKKSTIAPWW